MGKGSDADAALATRESYDRFPSNPVTLKPGKDGL